MPMPHLRSEKAKQRRTARKLVIQSSYRDHERAETVCLLDGARLADLLSREFDGVHQDVVDVTRGEVIVDSRGEGSFQKMIK